MADTTYATDQEKLDDAIKRIERIMRLRGVSGFAVVTIGDKSKDHFTLGDQTIIQTKRDKDAVMFMANFNSKTQTIDQATKTLNELAEIGGKVYPIAQSVEKFLKHLPGMLKSQFKK